MQLWSHATGTTLTQSVILLRMWTGQVAIPALLMTAITLVKMILFFKILLFKHSTCNATTDDPPCFPLPGVVARLLLSTSEDVRSITVAGGADGYATPDRAPHTLSLPSQRDAERRRSLRYKQRLFEYVID